MGYELTLEQSVADNIKRILKEELSASVALLENIGDNKEEAIHTVRKRIKKVRAVFRIIRKGIGDEIFSKENIRYRNIGHTLSHLRDATVMIKTLDALKEKDEKIAASAAFAKARATLVKQQQQISEQFFSEQQKISEVITAFKEGLPVIDALPLAKNSFGLFAPNLKNTYRRGTKAYALVNQEPTTHNFHELRKEVKNMWYYTRIFSPLWPAVFGAYSKELENLSEILGQEHDLGVLGDQINSGKLPYGSKAAKSKITALIDQQKIDLQKQVYPLAQRIFAESSEEFVNRHRLYWRIWRSEKQPFLT